MKRPKQVTIGGALGGYIWRTRIVPILRMKISTRKASWALGVSAMTISRWRRLAAKKPVK